MGSCRITLFMTVMVGPAKAMTRGCRGPSGYARRNFMVPIPRFTTWPALNVWLTEQCRIRPSDVLRGHQGSIGQGLARDPDALWVMALQSPRGQWMMALPASPFEACDQVNGLVNSQSLVHYKTNYCSVPVAYGHPLPSGACLHAREGSCLAALLC